MAMNPDGADLREHAPHARYGEVRSGIRTGDILLFQGTSALSRFIRWGSQSTYSHAGMAAWWGPRLVVLQAAGRGVEVLPVSSAVDDYDGRVDWWTIHPDYDAQLNRNKLVDHAITELGKPYATVGLATVVWRMAVGRFRGLPDPKADPEAMFCSQYVSYCYRVAGLDLCPDTSDDCTSPGDLALSGRLTLEATLHSGRVAPDIAAPDIAAADIAAAER